LKPKGRECINKSDERKTTPIKNFRVRWFFVNERKRFDLRGLGESEKRVPKKSRERKEGRQTKGGKRTGGA